MCLGDFILTHAQSFWMQSTGPSGGARKPGTAIVAVGARSIGPAGSDQKDCSPGSKSRFGGPLLFQTVSYGVLFASYWSASSVSLYPKTDVVELSLMYVPQPVRRYRKKGGASPQAI
jgi:hypothetical protein